MKEHTKYVTKPFLRQLNDHSGGGFVLFHFDEERLPVLSSNFEGHSKALALQYYIQNWSKALEVVNIEAMTSGIMDDSDFKDDDPEDGAEDI